MVNSIHADPQCIERYLNTFNPEKLKKDINRTVKGRMAVELFPILFFAVERNSPEIVRLLCKAGADTSKSVKPNGLPLLAYTVLTSEYDLSDTTESMIALLVSGADPSQIPTDMWEAPLKTPRGDSPKIAENGERKALSWCTKEIRKTLARNVTLMQRYLLWRTRYCAPQTERMTQMAEAFSILPLLETRYHVIGQTPAIQQVTDAIASHYLFSNASPLVLLFTGPSGHGKTEVAKRMGELLGIDIHIADCTEMKHETDILGPQRPYMGSQLGSNLNNFLGEHSGKRAVVFLDEFEKSTPEVHKAMLLPFDSRLYVDRRDSTRVDCTKIIWILAANVGAYVIHQFWSTQVKDRPAENQANISLEEMSRLLESVIMKTFGPPLTGRLSSIVPFLPFNDLEQAVATYKYMQELKNEVRKPVDIGAKLFPRRLILDSMEDGQVAQHLARRRYIPELGARSLQKAVHRDITQRLAHAFLREDSEIHDGMNEKPMAAYQVRLITAGDNGQRLVLERNGVKDVLRQKEDENHWYVKDGSQLKDEDSDL